ncbi:MAG: HTH domain-containing protein [Clostridium butyricum]|nr:HTH domain-containing protein [Clostridium butyricum]
MKIDRLLGITIYLLNHKRTPASTLSEHFEVSIRTIMRDIDTLCLAGIPVISIAGVNGGFEIMDSFKILRQSNIVQIL